MCYSDPASPSVTFGVSFFAAFLGYLLCTKEEEFYCLHLLVLPFLGFFGIPWLILSKDFPFLLFCVCVSLVFPRVLAGSAGNKILG